MPSVIAYGCDDATTQFHPLQIDIREPGEGEIYFDVALRGHLPLRHPRRPWRVGSRVLPARSRSRVRRHRL